jgi:hypothetical protein
MQVPEPEPERGGPKPDHHTIVLNQTWWYAAHISLCLIALGANVLFLVTVLVNRRRSDIKSFVTAVIVTVAALDVLDVLRTVTILVPQLYDEATGIYMHVYCSLGVFHELAVAAFLISLSIAVAILAGKEPKVYASSGSTASLPQKILIPLTLLLAAGAAAPFFLLPRPDQVRHSCTNPFRVISVISGASSAEIMPGVPHSQASEMENNIYSTAVTAVTYILPVLVIPLALLVASVRTCVSRRCCVPRFKQPIGELIMVLFMTLIYLASIVGVMLPIIDKMLEDKLSTHLGAAPLLWELGNNAVRPLIYFCCNPAIWDGLRSLCCRKKDQLVNEDDDEIEMPLSPVTSV